MKNTHRYDHAEFNRTLEAATLNETLADARTVYLALPAAAQASIVDACSGLAGIPGCGAVTAFEIMVATARLIERRR